MNVRFPRAKPAVPVAIAGDTWNVLCEIIERNDRLTAAPPLMLEDTRAGRRLSVVPNDSASNAVIVHILNAYTPSGTNITAKYDGVIYYATNTAAGAAMASMPEGLLPRGVPANPISCLVVNEEEDPALGYSAAHNNLQPGTWAVGTLGGMSTETPPRQVVFIRGGVAPMDSGGAKIQIGGATAAEGGDTADTATWNRLNNSVSLTAWVPSRVEYNDSGDQILYQFFRLWSFDARGLLVSVGAESRVVVDAPTVCGTVPGGGGATGVPASSLLLMGA